MATILIVEDSEDTRVMMQDLLQALGHVVLEAVDGLEGVRRALSKPSPELIVMDLMMPNASGDTTLKFMRGTPEFKNIPILIVSAHSDIEMIARSGGADAWMAKPVHMEALRKKIDVLLQDAAARKASPSNDPATPA